MRSKLETPIVAILTLAFAGVTVLLFLPHVSILPVFSAYLFIILAIQSFNKSAYAFTLIGFATLLGVFCGSKAGDGGAFALFASLLALWGGGFLLYLHQEKRRTRLNEIRDREDTVKREADVLMKEISFYEKRRDDLRVRADKRRHLVSAARELGACLDPTDIQNKLVAAAELLFPQRPVGVSIGHNPDAIDMVVVQKGQPVLIPSPTIKGLPTMAVPVRAQGVVAGVLRVGGDPGPAFTQDDLRLLDILGSLASLSLENSALFHRVQESALRDNLTGLWTHKAFQDHLEAAILEASRYNQPLSVILADVDHFKSINDNYGHPAGDQILRGFADVLQRHVRDVDIVSRYGGEEFIILLLQTPAAEASRVAEEIRTDLESQRFGVSGSVVSVTASFGVATFPSDATSGQQLIRTADERLYAAKKAGRNRVMWRAA